MTKAYYSVKDWGELAREMELDELAEVILVFETVKREKERKGSFVDSGTNSMKWGKKKLREVRFR